LLTEKQQFTAASQELEAFSQQYLQKGDRLDTYFSLATATCAALSTKEMFLAIYRPIECR
jgi:hypothetical protein